MNEAINDGGPAFPVQDAASWQAHGMTLRDYFAANAIAEASRLEERHPCGPLGIATYEGIATRAYLIADSMLKARQA